MAKKPEKLTVSVGEAAKMLGVSKGFLYPLILSGQVPSLKLGRRRLVSVEALRAWVASHGE